MDISLFDVNPFRVPEGKTGTGACAWGAERSGEAEDQESSNERWICANHTSDGAEDWRHDNEENGVVHELCQTSVYKGYKRDKIEMRGDRAEMSDFPLYLNTVAGGLDRRDQTIGGFSFVVKIYAVPVVEIIG